MNNQSSKVRVADYLAERVYQLGVEDVFMITGGGAMFLDDGVASHPKLRAVCNHHEQACAMGAVAYAKLSGKIGVVYPTTGCGGTNTITGLLDAWQDNVPCLFISGQANRNQTTRNVDLPLRQIGVQEVDIVEIVKSITKYAVMINDPNEIAYHFDKAIYLATHGRPGPVWLDIPLDVQGAYVDRDQLKPFIPDEMTLDYREELTDTDAQTLKDLFRAAERPVIIAGNGVRLANAVPQFKAFVEQHNIPVVVTYLGVDLLQSDHPQYVGRIGIKGDRAGNFAVQNADLILAIGTRLSVPIVGYRPDTFAREAKIAVVDIDPYEHQKEGVKIDLYINADAKNFLENSQIEKPDTAGWAERCRGWRDSWPVCLPEYSDDKEGINLYYFMERLSAKLKDDAVVCSDAGSAYYVVSQALKVTTRQRYITPAAQAELGFTIPAAIGASIAKNCEEVIGITGDGSFQTNLQELQTILHYKLPVKLFIWNNHGYLSNKTTQRKYFDDRFIGTDKSHGVSFPAIDKIAGAYGITYFKVSKIDALDQMIDQVLDYSGPVICEVMCPEWQEIVPTLGAKKTDDGRIVARPFEDMYPFLDRDEFQGNMIVEPLDESK